MKSGKDLFLVLACLSFCSIIGGAVYEHTCAVPFWTQAPPISLTMFQGPYGLDNKFFWMIIHPVTILLLSISLFLNWKTNRRNSLFIVLGSYAVIMVMTAIYFVPELLSIIQTPFSESIDPALQQRASKWEMLSLVRLAGMFILGVVLLYSLTKGNTPGTPPAASEIPLSYQNDALGG